MEERVKVSAKDIESMRRHHIELLDAHQKLKESAISEGNTMLAVKVTESIKTVHKMIQIFEEMVEKDFDVIET